MTQRLMADASDDLVVELDAPQLNGPLQKPITGVEGEGMPPWALPSTNDGGGGVIRRWPRAWGLSAANLANAFPRAWSELKSRVPDVDPDDVFDDRDGRGPAARWDRFVADLERLEFDIAQQRAAKRVPRCSRCQAESVLDEFGRCFLECE